MKRFLLAAFALLVGAFVSLSHISASQIWILTGSLPQARFDHRSFTLPDGRVLVAGEGDTGAGGPLAPVSSYIYDPAAEAWSAGPMPLQSHQGAMSVKLADGRFMIAGGRHDGGVQSNVEIFDPATNTWMATGSLVRGRVLGTLTLLPNGKVLAAGGYTNQAGFDPTAELWNPLTNTWTMTGSMTHARWQHSATLLDNGKVLIAGGERYFAPGGDDLNVVEIYDTSAGTWSPGASMTTRRATHSAAKLADGRVIVAGGITGAPATYNVTASTELYDPATNTWSAGAAMPLGRANFAPLVAMPDGTLIVVGGQTSVVPSSVTAAVHRYNPATNAWSVMPSMNVARMLHTANVLPNGEILVAGGHNGSTALSAAERLIAKAPDTTATLSPQANGNGWNNSNVTVTLNATVSTGSVQSITYSLSGAHSGEATVAGSQALITLTAEGTTTIVFHATDNANNVEADQSLTVKIDKTLPFLSIPNNIVATATQSGGAFVNFIAGGSDALSGVVSSMVSPRLSGQLFPVGTTHETVTVTDAAGNTAVGGFDVTVVPGRPFITISGGTFTIDGNPHPATVSVTQGNGSPVAGTTTIAYAPGGAFAPTTPGQYSAAVTFNSGDPAFTSVFPWTTAASDPVARQGGTGGVINGKLYVVGGHPFGDPNLDDPALFGNYAYDPQANAWTQRAAPLVGRNQTGGDVINDRLHVVGGCINSNCGAFLTGSHYAYDPASDGWTQRADMLAPRAFPAVGAINGMLYVAGGGFPYDATNTLQVYDAASNNWSYGPNMPHRSHSSAGAVVGGKLYVMGGFDASGPTTRVQVYDPSSATWSTRAPMLTTQANAATSVINNRIYVFGGANGLGAIINTVQSYDPNTDTWTLEASLPTQRYAAVAGVISGRVYVTGGAHQPSQVTGATEVFDPSLTTHITILQETQPPSSNHNAPFPNGNGWFNADVNVTINAFDGGFAATGVQSITYSLSGAQTGGATVTGSSTSFTIVNEGATTVRYHATDNAGNVEGDHFFTVNIDKTAPAAALTLGSPANANGWHKFSPNVQVSATDNAGGSTVQSIAYTLTGAQTGSFNPFASFTSFNIFNQGVTTIAYRATDKAGNTSADQFFTVRYDAQQPVFNAINNITVNATSPAGAVVNYPQPTATDATSGVATIVASHASGSTFPHGSTTVTVTATDLAGNVATRNFTVTVNKTLLSINVLPNTATINEGDSQSFQAQGVFTDGTTAMLPTGGSGGGGGGGSSSSSGAHWNLHFDDSLNLAQCNASQSSFSSQAITGSSTLPAAVDSLWGPSNSVVRATGTVTTTDVSLTLTCVNGQGAPGSLNATFTGTRYEGTWNFSGTSGAVTVRGWSPKQAAPTARFSIGAATVNGVVYVMGRDNPSLPSPVEAYTIATNTWSNLGDMPTSREGASYAVLNGKIYAAGGHVSGGAGTNTVDVYDTATNTWSVGAPMNSVRAQFALVAAGNKLFAIGGETGANGAPLTATVEAYDPISGIWTPQASMATARRFHVAGAVNNGSLIVVSGGNQSQTSSTEFYDVATNSWSVGPAPHFQIDGARAVVINNAMFVVGGTAGNGSTRVQMFRPVTGQSPAGWSLPGDMPTGRGQLAVAAAGGTSDVLYAIGGLRNGVSVTTVESMSTPPPTDLFVSSGSSGSSLPTVTFTSSNPTVATINGSGQAFGMQAGETTIVASANGISCAATGTCATLTVVNPECAKVVLTVTPAGSLPFNTVRMTVETEETDGPFDLPFGPNEFDTEPGVYVVHFEAPDGYRVTPNTLTVITSCEATARYEVIVEPIDSTPPSLTVSPNVTAEATSPAGAPVTFAAPSANDDLSGVASVSCDRNSGDQFPIGETTVNCQATDNEGNQATASFTVTVVDTIAPALTVSSNKTAEATSSAGAFVAFDAPTATDGGSGVASVSCDRNSGDQFSIGATTVNCQATDNEGNQATASFTVTVVDTIAPALTVSSNKTAEATSSAGAFVAFDAPTATDGGSGVASVSCDRNSGDQFPIGETTVNCQATDNEGNQATASFTVTVVDTIAPALTVSSNRTAEATSSAGAFVAFDAPTATDGGSGVASVSCDRNSGDQFSIGATTVNCQATDNEGNQTTASFIVSVLDTTAPSLTPPANIVTNATSPSGAIVSFTATAVDLVDSSPSVTCEVASGTLFPIGLTTVTCAATDASGNVSTGSFSVVVLSGSEIVTNLIGEIDNFPQANGLLNNVLASISNGNISAACSQLSAFISQVQAQAGKKLTQAEAAQLLQIASAARAAIGCQ